MFLSSFAGLLHFVPNIFSGIVGERYSDTKLHTLKRYFKRDISRTIFQDLCTPSSSEYLIIRKRGIIIIMKCIGVKISFRNVNYIKFVSRYVSPCRDTVQIPETNRETLVRVRFWFPGSLRCHR